MLIYVTALASIDASPTEINRVISSAATVYKRPNVPRVIPLRQSYRLVAGGTLTLLVGHASPIEATIAARQPLSQRWKVTPRRPSRTNLVA
jgi:hypothetical protein